MTAFLSLCDLYDQNYVLWLPLWFGRQYDDTGWHAPEGWDEFWGHPEHDFWLSDAEFAKIRSQIDGIY